MVLNRVGPMSVAKISGAIYCVVGFIGGCFFALVALFGSSVASATRPGFPLGGALFGVGAIVALPVLYGILGFLAGLLGAALYNWLAGVVGGIEMEFGEGSLNRPDA